MSAPRTDDVLTRSHVAVSDARDYFNLLPNEIFTVVLDFVYKPVIDSEHLQESNIGIVKKVLLSLTLVNRRFNAFATPLLYKCIEVIYPGNRLNQTSLGLLRRTFTGKPSLRHYFRKFRLKHDLICRNDAELDRRILKILDWATHLTHLILSGFFSENKKTISGLIKVALANSTSLRHVSVRDVDRSVSTSEIIKVLTEYPSSIQELLLDGVVCNNESSLRFIPLQNNDTASLRTLHLHNILNNPEATTDCLLKWSKSLEELSLSGSTHHCFSIDFKNLLSPCKDTLVVLYLDLPILPDHIDFSSLTALEELTLIYWPLITSTHLDFSEDLGRKLLTPQMRRLNWLFVGSQPRLCLNSLNGLDEKWLCDLGDYATQHCSRLRIIHVKHDPLLQFDDRFLPFWPFTISELDLPRDMFGRIQLFFETLGPDFLYETVEAGELSSFCDDYMSWITDVMAYDIEDW